MTAVVSVNTPAAPGSFLIAGQLLERWGVVPVFAGVAGGMSGTALVFSAIVLRHRDDAEEPAVPLHAAA
jgi:hypothetical protein